MSETPMDDNDSIQSDDSNVSTTVQKEKLESLINMELKHSGVFYDLHSKNNLLKVDLENLYNSCQRFESQIKKKTECLEEKYDKLSEYQNDTKNQLRKKLLSIVQKLEETNTSFCEAYEDYSPGVLRNTINYLIHEADKLDKSLADILENLKTLQIKGGFQINLMKPKPSKTCNLEIVSNMLLEMSMKRPEIELKESYSRLTNEIKKLEQQCQDLKTILKK